MESIQKRASSFAPRIQAVNVFVIALSSFVSLLLAFTTFQATDAYRALRASTTQYVECRQAASSLKEASLYLTSCARVYVMTHNTEHVANFYEEVYETKRRELAIETLQSYLEDDDVAMEHLTTALELSNALAVREARAMLLVSAAEAYALEGNLAPLAAYELSPEDAALPADEQLSLAQELVFGEYYTEQRALIDSNVNLCSAQLIESTQQAQEREGELLSQLLVRQRILTTLLLLIVVGMVLLVITLILRPLERYTALIDEGKPLEGSGMLELRLLADEYNEMYEESRRRTDHLRHKANHDSLTGLFNRGAYDELSLELAEEVALVLVDVDHFKDINDTYGHEAGDQILQKLAGVLRSTFRSSDYPCRIGGDEFAVIMTDVTPELKPIVKGKVEQIREGLLDTSDGLPATTLSIGVAFGTQVDEGSTLFKTADRTLYAVKERGRNGYAFADEVREA